MTPATGVQPVWSAERDKQRSPLVVTMWMRRRASKRMASNATGHLIMTLPEL